VNALPCVASVFSLNTNIVAADDDVLAQSEVRQAALLLNKLFYDS